MKELIPCPFCEKIGCSGDCEEEVRAKVAALQAQVDKLTEIIRKAEWAAVVNAYSARQFRYTCPLCGNDERDGHLETCQFNNWEGGE